MRAVINLLTDRGSEATSEFKRENTEFGVRDGVRTITVLVGLFRSTAVWRGVQRIVLPFDVRADSSLNQ